MSAHRFFLVGPLEPGSKPQLLALSADDVHHAVDVLRLRVGEEIDVVTPAGAIWRAEVAGTSKQAVSARVVRELPATPSSRVTLFQGVAKGDKMDDIVRQAVEVGAEAIVPVLMSRSVVQLDARKRADRGERWRRVALAAAKQAKRTSVPDVSDPQTLREAIALLGAFDGAVVLWEESDGIGIADAVLHCATTPEARIALVVGPEGGISAEEIAALESIGAKTASLGPNILRTETAAIVGLALAIGALGGLGGSRE